MTHEESLKEYLVAIARLHKHRNYKYSSIEELLIKRGKFFTPQKHPDPVNIFPVNIPKRCYLNCQELAFEDPSLTYTEGFALTTFGFPVAHAWIELPDGSIAEPTWKETGNAYCGIGFTTSWLIDLLCYRREIGVDIVSVIDYYALSKDRQNILKEGLPIEALR